MGVSVGPGATIAGRYRLESPIGEGGFGAVFRATDLRSGGLVAVKVLTEGAVESGARFRREAELAMRLSHPNTVRTHDAGEDAGSGLYIVLELLEGGSLEQVLRAHGGFGAQRAAEIALAVLGSLREAHAIGIVHRDIKPANVFLQRTPAGGVKVLDFGIAKSTNEGTRAGLTKEGQTIGTPAYMAPEQVKGGDLGPETDLYALGLVLAEAISGKPVYATDNGLAVLIDKLNGKDPPLPAALKGTPLEAVVSRATRHNREDRYRSADEMSRAIEGALAEMPRSSSAPGDRRSMRTTGQPGMEWGTESMPYPSPSSSPTEVGNAETFGMDIPSLPGAGSSQRSSEAATSAMAILSSAPTAAQELPRGRLSSASELPVSAPVHSYPVSSAPIASAPVHSQPAASAPRASVPVPSAPAFSADPNASPYASPYASPSAGPAPTLPPEAPAAAKKKTSGFAVGCTVAAVIALLAFVGAAGVVAYLAYHRTGGRPARSNHPKAPRAPTTAKPGSAAPPPAAPAPPLAPPAARTPAVAITCPGLSTLGVQSINPKVNAAPGYKVQNQTNTVGAGSSVEITMKRNGEDWGRLVFIEGASPGALPTQEAARKPEEPDAIYAVKGGKLLYIVLPLTRAQDLLPSLCGPGAGPMP
jgi:serine/threonine protein kinase